MQLGNRADAPFLQRLPRSRCRLPACCRFLQAAGTVKNMVRPDVQMLRQQELEAQVGRMIWALCWLGGVVVLALRRLPGWMRAGLGKP